ncbi:hypothetical protein KCP76_05980 [Salmonella enterica subsp. enterica serovar Weltevreden]|nr:hypothetical protein KCP76_05980 [Salmonella enterica subsp. enterica serovar Weltevreden]
MISTLALRLSDLCPCRSGKRGATRHKAAPERAINVKILLFRRISPLSPLH